MANDGDHDANNDHLQRQFAEVLRPFMVNVPDPDLSIYLMGVAAHAIIHTVTADRPDLLTLPAFTAEVVTLLENYLQRPEVK